MRHLYAAFQSGGGKMDGIQLLFSEYIRGTMSDLHRNEVNGGGEFASDIIFFIPESSEKKKAYNYHDYGNYNWGGAMYELGFDNENSLEYILKKANQNNNNIRGGDDTQQLAI